MQSFERKFYKFKTGNTILNPYVMTTAIIGVNLLPIYIKEPF